MKKLNSKGFTLIELLAVIAILIIISTIAISSISSAVERNKVKQDDTKKAVIVSYAKLYFEKNKNSYNDKTAVCVTLDKLSLSEEEGKDADGNLFTGAVKVTKINTGNPTFDYIDNVSDCP